MFDETSENILNSWKEDIKSIINLLPKNKDKILEQLDKIEHVEGNKYPDLKIDIEVNSKRFEMIIKKGTKNV